MDLKIVDDRRLEDIKEAFSKHFPFLKIEFFKKAHDQGSGSPVSEMITDDVTIGDIRSKQNSGEINIHEDMKVADLEQEFENKYGMHVQVFRKSGNIWLETSATDDWTLKTQNSTGMEMSES